jgi:CheY-like chemotaxis protein
MAEIPLLLVEDNEDDRFLTIRMLSKLPLELRVDIAKSGDDALKLIMAIKAGGQELPALILLDLQLPKIDGIKCLTCIRERYNEKELPVIILSSSDNPGDIALCRELGINGYIIKPLDFAHLQLIAETLAGNQAGSLPAALQQGPYPDKFV